jgi:hypothetical protein
MEGHRVRGRPGYRCRHGTTSAHPAQQRLPPLYLREDVALRRITAALDCDPPGAVTNYLKANDLTVTCTRDGCMINPPAEARKITNGELAAAA